MWMVVVMMMEWEARETMEVYFITDWSNACATLLISEYWTPVRLGHPR